MPANKPALDPQYEIIDPAFVADHDHWDDSEPTNIQELDRELAQQSSTELAKVAVRQSRRRALLRVCALLVPVAVSFAILQFSWRQRYWRDSNDNPVAISENLAVLQIAAKAHEVCIVLSLSDLVLHYLRQRLSSSCGLPFGLFISAYQVALGGQPISLGFFYSIRTSVRHKIIQWQSIWLALVLLLATLVGLASGPASAIVLIPRLNWWPRQDLFAFYKSPDDYGFRRATTFQMYIAKQLFPSVVDASSLPGPYCLSAHLDVNASCPYAGYSQILPTLNFTAPSDNVTIDSPSSRYLFTQVGIYGVAHTWTTSHVLANYLSLALGTYDVGENPSTVESLTQHSSVMTPIVSTYCDQQPATTYDRSLTALATSFSTLLASDGAVPPSGFFDVRQIWNETILAKSNDTMVAFEDGIPNASISGTLAFIYTPASDRNKANITMCGIRAIWDANKMWMLSSGIRGVVSSNFTWAAYTEREDNAENAAAKLHKVYGGPIPIIIRKEWAEALNGASNTSNIPVLSQFMQDGITKANQEIVSPYDETVEYPGTVESIILSKAIADGLARIGSEYRVNPLYSYEREVTVCRNRWCSSGAFVNPGMDPAILNGTVGQYSSYTRDLRTLPWTDEDQLLQSFAEPANVDDVWTKISFPVKRYGYAWSFDTVTIKIATAVLMLHALIIIIHSCVLLFTGCSYAYASSLGGLVALAFNSRPPAALRSTSVAIGKGTSWARPTAVRESHGQEKDGVDHLQLVVDEGLHTGVENGLLHRRPVTGKRYQ